MIRSTGVSPVSDPTVPVRIIIDSKGENEMTRRFGQWTILILFFGSLALMIGSFRYRQAPSFSLKAPFVRFVAAATDSVDEEEKPTKGESAGSPELSTEEAEILLLENYEKAFASEKYAQPLETVTTTYYPPVWGPTVVGPPVYYPVVTDPTTYVVGNPTYVLPPPIIVRRPFFQSIFP